VCVVVFGEQLMGQNVSALDRQQAVVLLVEDDPGQAALARRVLEHAGAHIQLVHVSDGQAALDYLFQQGAYIDPTTSPRPHIVLLDLRLPRVDGLEVLRTVKDDPALRTIPVVVLTTSSSKADIAQAYAHYASSYVIKPVDFEKYTCLMQTLASYWLVWNVYPEG